MLKLADYNFILIHAPGKTNTIADLLSRPSSEYISNVEDNHKQVILSSEWFAVLTTTVFVTEALLKAEVQNSTEQDDEVSDAISVLCSRGLRCLISDFQNWKKHEGLVYHKDKLYISKDTKLRA